MREVYIIWVYVLSVQLKSCVVNKNTLGNGKGILYHISYFICSIDRFWHAMPLDVEHVKKINACIAHNTELLQQFQIDNKKIINK
jgi:hypothetical protein